MGGRGSSSGISKKEKIYGSQFHAEMDPHVHHGYYHNENDGPKGASNLNREEKKMLDRVKEVWYNYLRRK